ncbi:MAG: hypothetical protein WC515_03040 [Candidatus Omnitrophota bacterium]
MKKVMITFVTALFSVSMLLSAHAADTKDEASKPAAAQAMPAIPQGMPPGMPRPNFTVLFGALTKIDTSDPAKPVLEVKNERDNKVHSVELTPTTGVAKITDISELKPGDTVRIMARSSDGKETALNVAFGKVKAPVMGQPSSLPPGQGVIRNPAPSAAPQKAADGKTAE